jgi:capsular polysaccharide export protein
MSKLHFVFLQGMPSPFFSRIGARLTAAGCRVTGINLCFGDWFFWRGANTVNYRGSLADWPAFLDEFCVVNAVTDIVLLGEQRNYHQRAVSVAHARGVRVTVTDFGYLRPDWITLERDGMGGNSRFPKTREAIASLALHLPPPDLARRYADSSARMSAGDLLYHFGNVFLWWLYPRYRRSDQRPHPFLYTPASIRRGLSARAGRRRAAAALEHVCASAKPYFVFPLQLEHDFQIVAYSPFANLDEPIRLVIQSFARHAHADACLLVKAHPWDPGLKNWAKRVGRWAAEAGVAARVIYLDGGDLDAMIPGSAGMVTVNSTSGIRALQLGSPVKVLGQAIYDVPGLTFQGHLDAFWRAPQAPDAALVESFIRALAGTIQIRGVFFSDPGLTAAVSAAVERLLVGTVGEPQTADARQAHTPRG